MSCPIVDGVMRSSLTQAWRRIRRGTQESVCVSQGLREPGGKQTGMLNAFEFLS